MDRYFRACAWAVAFFALPFVGVASAQTITVREINPTRSTTGGNAATGGRVNKLARATDTTFYAASEFGGLFKSMDAGRTWVRLDAHIPTRVSDVKASPSNPAVLIATSRYDGRVSSLAGISRSTNGGVSWSKPATSSPPAGFCDLTVSFDEPTGFGIAFDPDNAAHVFAGTNCGLAKSTNGGQTWTFLNPGSGAKATNVVDVIVHHGGIIDTCGSDGHRRSTNGGTSWTTATAGGTPLPSGNCSITASPDESYVLFATVGTRIFETNNAGGTWNTEFTNPAPQGRVPFVVTNKRQGRNFDLWFGDVTLFRAGCTTPTTPAQGGAARCPASSSWTAAQTGAHSDLGDVVFTNPPKFNVNTCLQNCTNTKNTCKDNCAVVRDACLDAVDPGPKSGPAKLKCNQAFNTCTAKCSSQFNVCDSKCNKPQEGCPIVMSSDGGAFFNTLSETPACQSPTWSQPDVTTRALWLFSLSGGNISASLAKENLYMGAQDNGTFSTQNAGGATPSWTNPNCCDSTDAVSNGTQVLFSLCCFSNNPPVNRLIKAKTDLTGQSQIPNYPPGNVPRGTFPEVIATFGANRFAVITTTGIFSTQNLGASTITWTALGTNAPTNACALWAVGPSSSPTFFAQTGNCSGNSPGTLMRYNGTSTTGAWQNVTLPPGATGIGVFTADRNNPNRLFASALDATDVHMFRSTNGGTNWTADTTLDGLMNGGGAFRRRTSNYAQPTLVAFDPNNSDNLVAGAADAGVFISRNNGSSWTTVTNNSGNSANPVIPRPYWAYFDRECSQYNIFIGTWGRGAWQLSYHDTAGITVSACQAKCDAPFADCQNECTADRDACMAKVGTSGGPLASQCASAFVSCKGLCTSTRNTCRQRCVDCPQ